MQIKIGRALNRVAAKALKLVNWSAGSIWLETPTETIELEMSLDEAQELKKAVGCVIASLENKEANRLGKPFPWDLCDDCGAPVHSADEKAVRFVHPGSLQTYRVRCWDCQSELYDHPGRSTT
jgi:hypothetical protein